MSISRVIIRLEIADDSALPGVRYTAAIMSAADDDPQEPKMTYAAATQASKELFDRQRGRRSPGTLTVETHASTIADDDDDDDDDNDDAEFDDDDVKRKVKLEASSSEERSQSRPSSGRARTKSHSPAEKSLSSLRFFSGNPTVETTDGVIHLYKEDHKTSLDKDEKRPDMLCMLAVPASMNIKDLVEFLQPAMSGIEQLKIIRDPTPNQFMVLVKFREQSSADEFYHSYNNRPYNSIEPEICHLVYVARVEAVSSSDGACFPIPGWTELPYCPVCLERMDESVDGILTILCNHSFHGSCLSQWSDTTCPVCRFLQTPEAVAGNVCMQCDSLENLWICLICGHVGCGRYQGGHARRHYEETQHTYSMQLGNNRVWDYAGDNYVHRLVQNKGDGKLVEVSGDEHGHQPGYDEKFESITLEYTYLLTSQLESQRLYFEEKMSMIERQIVDSREESDFRSKKSEEECEILAKQLSENIKEKYSMERKVNALSARLNKVLHDLQEERDMNTYLRENQQRWQSQVSQLEVNSTQTLSEKDKELKDLREQLRDVMVHLGAQSDLSHTHLASQDDIQGGHIFVAESETTGATGVTKKRRSKKK